MNECLINSKLNGSSIHCDLYSIQKEFVWHPTQSCFFFRNFVVDQVVVRVQISSLRDIVILDEEKGSWMIRLCPGVCAEAQGDNQGDFLSLILDILETAEKNGQFDGVWMDLTAKINWRKSGIFLLCRGARPVPPTELTVVAEDSIRHQLMQYEEAIRSQKLQWEQERREECDRYQTELRESMAKSINHNSSSNGISSSEKSLKNQSVEIIKLQEEENVLIHTVLV